MTSEWLHRGWAAAASLLLASTVSLPGLSSEREVGMAYADASAAWRTDLAYFSRGAITIERWQDDGALKFTHNSQGLLWKADANIVLPSQARDDDVNNSAAGLSPRLENDFPLPAQAAVSSTRDRDVAFSPDGSLSVVVRNGNLSLRRTADARTSALTRDGSAAGPIGYGRVPVAYQEELSQSTAIWWAPDGSRFAFLRFVATNGETSRSRAKPRRGGNRWTAGADLVVSSLAVYHVGDKRVVHFGRTSAAVDDAEARGTYTYSVSWAPADSTLIFYRVNRKQNALDVIAANSETGQERLVVREASSTGWTDLRPTFRWLSDGRRFLWSSERSGRRNLYLYNISGTFIQLTAHDDRDVGEIVKVAEDTGTLFYTAQDRDHHLRWQLHRVGLDGQRDTRLTDPAFNHRVIPCEPRPIGGDYARIVKTVSKRCSVSPDNRYIVDMFERHDIPPASRIADAETGATVATLAQPPGDGWAATGRRPNELFSFRSADGATTLYGLVQFPRNFDPSRRYPVLVKAYAAPGATRLTPTETFGIADPLAELGFLVVQFETRAAPGRGKRSMDIVYQRLGEVEVDDLVAGAKALRNRPYVDGARMGIFGMSYGGYSALMAVLRYPDLFAAAVASSAPTSWRHYSRLYSERYMGLVDESPEAYDRSDVVSKSPQLRSQLLLFYDTSDLNVSPQHSLALISRLRDLGKSFDVVVSHGRGHSELDASRLLQHFVRTLHPVDERNGYRVTLPAP